MYIKNSDAVDYGNFELDASSVGLHSLSDDAIKLPYTGPLPSLLSPAYKAFLHISVQITHGAVVMLEVFLADGGRKMCVLSTSTEELISVLDKFFLQSYIKTGLNRYRLGLLFAYYKDWKKCVSNPDSLYVVISSLSEGKKNSLRHLVNSCC